MTRGLGVCLPGPRRRGWGQYGQRRHPVRAGASGPVLQGRDFTALTFRTPAVPPAAPASGPDAASLGGDPGDDKFLDDKQVWAVSFLRERATMA